MTHRGPFQPRTFCDSVKEPGLACSPAGWGCRGWDGGRLIWRARYPRHAPASRCTQRDGGSLGWGHVPSPASHPKSCTLDKAGADWADQQLLIQDKPIPHHLFPARTGTSWPSAVRSPPRIRPVVPGTSSRQQFPVFSPHLKLYPSPGD